MKKVLVVILVILCLLALPIGIFLSIGHYLAPEDVPEKSDVIVVISGGGMERENKGLELWREGLAEYILFSGASEDPNSPSNAEVMKEIAIALGVPEDRILTEEVSRNTAENAFESQRVLEDHGLSISSLILVTSSYHQRRAYQNFLNVFGWDVTIYNAPAEVDFWSADSWWESEKSRRMTYIEIGKLVWGKITNK